MITRTSGDHDDILGDHENITIDHENISDDYKNITSDHENILELFKFMIPQNENWIHSFCLFIGLKPS